MSAISLQELDARVAGLARLHDTAQALRDVLVCGPAVIPGLQRALLKDKPQSVYQPRVALVEALAALGAFGALRNYLTQRTPIDDPVLRHSEEAVRNSAARMLAGQLDSETRQVLLDLADREGLAGAIEVLGEMREARAIPSMIRSLEDDVVRSAARYALLQLDRAAVSPLLDAAARPDQSGSETPSSRIRRQECLHILRRLGLGPQDWPSIVPLVDDSCPEIAAEACLLALESPLPTAQMERIALTGLSIWPKLDWMQAEDLRDGLLRCSVMFRPEVRTQIQRHVARPAS